MNVEFLAKHINIALIGRFFSVHDENQEIISQVLSANSLKKFQALVKLYGLTKITECCQIPSQGNIDTHRIFNNVHPVIYGDFI